MKPDLSVDLCGVRLSNPTILASGILGTTKQILLRVAEEGGAGAVVCKSISVEPRAGHHNPTILVFEAGLMNAVGYSNMGIESALKEFAKWESKKPLIMSLVAKDAEEFGRLAAMAKPIPCSAIEIVLSCPHTPGLGLLAGQGTPEATAEITKAVRKQTKHPLFVKISASLPAIGEIAKAAEKEGADAITCTNSIGPGMVINLEARKPVLDFKVGGVSGPAIRPIAVRSVYDLYQAVKIPIIGCGGVTTGKDAIEFVMAGARAVQIGSATYYRGINVFEKVCGEMEDWMKKNQVGNLDEIIGAAHD